MKLVIQIPCLNESESLPLVLGALPRQLSGVSRIEWLVIDDGSTDETAAIAAQFSVDHIITMKKRNGLARAYAAGISTSLAAGADIIVSIDGDNQYNAIEIEQLIRPILYDQADIVIGRRPKSKLGEKSVIKGLIHTAGSAIVSFFTGRWLPDAVSGFRAYSRNAAAELVVMNNYTYTIETIVQAAATKKRISSVPINTNSTLRPSRLIPNLPSYLLRQTLILVCATAYYRPLRLAAISGGMLLLLLIIFPDSAVLLLWILFFSTAVLISGSPRRRIMAGLLRRICGKYEQAARGL